MARPQEVTVVVTSVHFSFLGTAIGGRNRPHRSFKIIEGYDDIGPLHLAYHESIRSTSGATHRGVYLVSLNERGDDLERRERVRRLTLTRAHD